MDLLLTLYTCEVHVKIILKKDQPKYDEKQIRDPTHHSRKINAHDNGTVNIRIGYVKFKVQMGLYEDCIWMKKNSLKSVKNWRIIKNVIMDWIILVDIWSLTHKSDIYLPFLKAYPDSLKAKNPKGSTTCRSLVKRVAGIICSSKRKK